VRTGKNRLPRLKRRIALSATFLQLVQFARSACDRDASQPDEQQKG
jgi:hypothetical protein